MTQSDVKAALEKMKGAETAILHDKVLYKEPVAKVGAA